MNKLYFPSLNGLRFIAAFMVIIHHVEIFRNRMGQIYSTLPCIRIFGGLGVDLFFVLSGFLITYLLLSEQNKTKTISIKDFYIRRILRIWPLYFFLIVIGFFLLPKFSFFEFGTSLTDIHNNFIEKTLMFLVFLPNVAFAFLSETPYLTQLWSVGVEEQFYLTWPVLMKTIKSKELLFYSIIGGYLFIKIVAFKWIYYHLFWYLDIQKLWFLFSITNIDCMAIGGLFALYLFRKDKKLSFFFSKTVQIITLAVLFLFIGFGIVIPNVHFEFYAIFFGILILNLAGNPRAIISLENKVFNYLGKISYGLYMYQIIAIVIALKVLSYWGISNPFMQHSFSIIVTIIIAGLSYRFYESYFINKKVKFSKIISGDNASLNKEKMG